jgi:putative endonuclease
MRSYWTYILAGKPRGTLYIGVTKGLPTRVEQHRTGKGSIFTRKYGVHMLVWYEQFANVRRAIQRKKTLKHYTRAWKISLIERTNPAPLLRPAGWVVLETKQETRYLSLVRRVAAHKVNVAAKIVSRPNLNSVVFGLPIQPFVNKAREFDNVPLFPLGRGQTLRRDRTLTRTILPPESIAFWKSPGAN